MSPREPEGPTAEAIGLDPSTVIQRSPLDPPSDPGPPVSMTVLRAACIHGRYEAHEVSTWTQIVPPCPGGRDITIDYEAARRVLQPADEADRPYFLVRATAIVAAAIGDTK